MNKNQRGFNRGRRGGNRGWRGNRPGSFQRDNYSGGPWYPNNFGNQNQWKWQKRETPGKRLSEEEIGVTEYMTPQEGFNGIIKSRYSDFQVSEINEKGEVAKLTNKKPPEPPAEDAVDEDEDLLLTKYNLEILPMETWDRINTLAVNTKPTEEKVEIDVTGVTKEQRTKIHDAVKKAFGESIVGSTISVEDKKFVRFEKYRKGVRIDNRVKWIWPGEYVHFIVHKENCDTMDAAVRITEQIGVHMKPSMLGYSGTKDRRAKTSQWFSVKRVDPRKLANGARHLKDIHIGNYTFTSYNLKLGMLKGNKFRIALRNVTAAEAAVQRSCGALQARGFLNYYGLQRFGTRLDTPTYAVGLKLLQGHYMEAIEAILEEREGPLQGVLRAYRQHGARAAATMLPRRAHGAHSEARLIRALADAPTDLMGAINRLARNTRLLYLHSYQSLLWNRAVSERIRRFGLNPAVGDLVALTQLQDLSADVEEGDVDESDTEENQSDCDLKLDGDNQETPQDGVDQEMDVNQDGGNHKSNSPQEEVKQAGDVPQDKTETNKAKKKDVDAPKPKIPVKVLTQDDVDSGRYTIFDIILPLPGYNIEYPPNMIEYYEENLKKDGLTLTMRHKIKSFSMSGAYRHVAVRPLDVSWSLVKYSDPYADLILSDIDELNNKELKGIIEDGKYTALLLTMTLPASCYATMALRELLKVDTSSDNQAQQNDYYKKDKKGEKRKIEEVKDSGETGETKGSGEGGGDGDGGRDGGGDGSGDGGGQELEVKKQKQDE